MKTTDSNLSKNNPPFLTEGKDAIFLKLYIQPRSSKNEIVGIHNETTLKIRLTSPPVDDAANSACIEFLAQILRVRKNQIEIASGRTSRIKQIMIKGSSLKEVKNILLKFQKD